MLREFFPNTNKGASIYGGFLHHENCFCKLFDMTNDIEDSIKVINEFLDINGYETFTFKDLDETYHYENGPVSISPHGYLEQFVLFLNRDVVSKTQLDFLINELSKFRDERDWGQIHNPKDLSIALSIKANELLAQFLWKSAEEANKEKVKEELADILSYAFLIAENYKLNIEEIVLDKIKTNSEKYPIDKSKGTSKKYDEL
jgi:NTP pyrophosphatase (non-canonical NTP hydrolase)